MHDVIQVVSDCFGQFNEMFVECVNCLVAFACNRHARTHARTCMHACTHTHMCAYSIGTH